MKRKLLLAALCVVGALGMRAQTDVTSQYISNPNFEGTEAITTEYKTYHKDVTDGCVSGLIAINGWIPQNPAGDAHAGGPVTYGSSVKLSGQTAPSSKPGDGTNGTALGIVSTWGADAQYLTDAVTLPVGTYTVTVKYYNTTSGTIKTNYFGFKESSGTTHYGENKSFTTTGSWTTEVVEFTLASETTGQFSVGLAMDGGNGGAVHIFLDNIKVEYDGTGHTAPSLGLRADVGASISTGNFIPAAGNYTLEVEGTIGIPINIAGAGINYTPTTNATVRFAKSGNVVYVYEGTEFKTVVAAGTPAFAPNIFTIATAEGSNNKIENGSFETLGDLISGQTDRYKFGAPWTSDVTEGGTGVRINTSGSTHRMCWRGRSNSHYFGQPITGLKPNQKYQISLSQVDHGNGKATWKLGLGTTAGAIDLCNAVFTLGGKSDNHDQNGIWYATITTPSTVSESTTYYFTFLNGDKVDDTGDPLTQIDWIALAEQDPLPITGVTSAKYTSDGAFRPATAKDAYDDALATAIAAKENSDYNVVTGSERTTLVECIEAEEPTTTEGYNTAATNLQNATNALIDATSHYQALIAAQAAVPDLEYASAEKKAFITATATSAADADDKVAAMTNNIRALYESNAKAEGVAGAVDKTSLLTNYNNPSNTNGWTITNTTGNSGMRTMSNESYTDADGTNNHSYFDSNSWGTAFSTTFTQNVELPAGTYILTAKARGNGTTTYQVVADGQTTNISSIGNTGGVFGRGWNDYTVEFTVATKKKVTLGINMETGSSNNWLSFGDFRLVRIAFDAATETEYDALNGAIAAAEAKTLGFEDGEYAPYNNVEALTALANANAVDQSVENAKADIEALTTALTDATWTANDGDVDAIYNGNMAVANGWNPKGWTRANKAWGKQVTHQGTTAWYYNENSTSQYGNDGVYTMPLAANTFYQLTLKYCSQGTNGGGLVSSLKVSVLNSDDEGLAEKELGANNTQSFVEKSVTVKTGAAGNYTLSIANTGNFYFTGVSLVKGVTEKIVPADPDFEGYKTFYNDDAFNYQADDNTTVYIAAEPNNGYVHLTEVGNIVPAGEAVILKTTIVNNANTNITLTPTSESNSSDFTDNKLQAAANNTVSNVYILACTNALSYGFYYYTGTLDAGDVYLTGDVPAAGAPRMVIVADGEATAINSVKTEADKANEATYNMAGQRVNGSYKGIVIKNGKKYMNK